MKISVIVPFWDSEQWLGICCESLTTQYGEDGLFVLECLAKGAYIHHGCYDEVTVKHKFINSHSLSKSKDMEGMLKQVHEYENFLVRQTDPKMIGTVCRELSALWGAEPRIKAMGGE